MIVNLGDKKRGYVRLVNSNNIVEHYLGNVSDKYEGEYVEQNKQLAKDFLAGRDLKKYIGLATATIYGCLALAGLMSGDIAFASQGIIDTAPLDKFFDEIYWFMFKILMYLATPVWAWVGIVLASGGANQEKRTLAKKIGGGLIVGTAVTASAPWATDQLFALWRLIF